MKRASVLLAFVVVGYWVFVWANYLERLESPPGSPAELLRLACLADSTQEVQYSRRPDHQHYLADCETLLALGGGELTYIDAVTFRSRLFSPLFRETVVVCVAKIDFETACRSEQDSP